MSDPLRFHDITVDASHGGLGSFGTKVLVKGREFPAQRVVVALEVDAPKRVYIQTMLNDARVAHACGRIFARVPSLDEGKGLYELVPVSPLDDAAEALEFGGILEKASVAESSSDCGCRLCRPSVPLIVRRGDDEAEDAVRRGDDEAEDAVRRAAERRIDDARVRYARQQLERARENTRRANLALGGHLDVAV